MSKKKSSVISSSRQPPMFDPVEIPLTKGYIAIVDPEDADLAQFKWSAREQDGLIYAYRRPGGKIRYTLELHRVILERKLHRPITRNELVDHKNRNGTDNRRENLRLATSVQNARNRKCRSESKTGAKGVYFREKTGKYEATITVEGIRLFLGSFYTREEAEQAYRRAADEHFGEFAAHNSHLE